MSSNVNIKYVNHSMNLDQPSVFVFTKNEIPSFDALREGVAWRVINKVGRGSSCNFTFPISTEISASTTMTGGVCCGGTGIWWTGRHCSLRPLTAVREEPFTQLPMP